MKVNVIIDVDFQFKNHEHFKVSKCRKVINCKTQKILKQSKNGGSIGYNIEGFFYNIKTIKNHLIKIPKKQYCPFSNNTIEI